MNRCELISKVFEFLGTCSEQELRRSAGSFPPDSAIAQALRHLAQAKADYERSSPSYARPIKPKAPRRAPQGSDPTLSAIVHERVSDPRVFPSAVAVSRFLNELKLGVTFRPKDGRREIERKLVRALNKLELSERDKKIEEIRRAADQTSGWFGAIRGKSS